MTWPQPQPNWTRPANQLASVSLALGLTSLAIVFWRWLPLIGLFISVVAVMVAIPAIITGHVAAQRARDLGGEGRALAISGLITGYFTVGFSIVAPIVSLVLFVFGAVGFAGDQLPQWLDEMERAWNDITR